MVSGATVKLILVNAVLLGLADCVDPVDKSPQSLTLEVQTASGPVRGTESGNTRVFLGIPYAASPVAEHRWKPPARMPAWTGVKDATRHGPACTQGIGGGSGPGVEDCLVINVWTPAEPSAESLAVFVWIHGGGFVVGSGNNAMLEGQRLSEAGKIVVVNFNYRLGLLGFLALPQLSAESDRNSTGAYGFLDQVAALRWVEENIAAFGGDPSQVTIGGNSAGAMSVCYHLVSNASRGLFQRVIMQSGSCTRPTPSMDEYAVQGEHAVARLDCDSSADVLACIRDRDAKRVTDAFGLAEPHPGGEFFQQTGTVWELPPAVDGVFLDEPVEQSLQAGRVARVPVIVGANQDEGGFFVYGQRVPDDEQGYIDALQRRYGVRSVDVLKEYPLAGFENTTKALAKISGDEVFFCSTNHTAQYLRDAGLDVYLYKFERPLQKLGFPWTSAFHTSEIPFVFGNTHLFTDLGESDLAYSAKVMPYWLRFIKTGNPNMTGVTRWPNFSSGSHIVFGTEILSAKDFGSDNCHFWKEFHATNAAAH